MMKRRFFAIVILLACFAIAVGRAADGPEDEAERAAEPWLDLVDKGSYGESWDRAAVVFKRALTQANWERAVGDARTPLGKLVSRKLKSRQYTETLPGAPNGRYVLIHYDSAFENKPAATELVIPMADPDGAWRVSGYFVR
jgi:hypothetical protein